MLNAHEVARYLAKATIPRRDKDVCWEWTGSRCRKGYGLFRLANGRLMRAHRFALATFGGGVADDQMACHRCDNPGCVNPSHLFAGSAADNAHDRDAKGRAGEKPLGENHSQSTLKASDIPGIRTALANGERQRDVAAAHGVSQYTIWSVAAGKTWGNA